MQTFNSASNPFALMLDPEAVFARISHSERLERLQRRVCHPLDTPLLGRRGESAGDVDPAADEFDDDLPGADDAA